MAEAKHGGAADDSEVRVTSIPRAAHYTTHHALRGAGRFNAPPRALPPRRRRTECARLSNSKLYF